MNNTGNRKLFRPRPGPQVTVLNWANAPDHEFSRYARAFRKAAKALVESWELDKGPSTDWDACPVIYLYRHAVELYLKGLLLGLGANFLDPKPSRSEVLNGHSLRRLMSYARLIFAAVDWDGELDPEGIRTFDELELLIAELDEVDSGSYTFRYPTKKDGQGSVPSYFTFSVTESAFHLDKICEVLDTAVFALPEIWREKAENLLTGSDLGQS